ncbi:P27 [Mulberry crinivirus]|nr:P27 [Mulberry crinivirus]
MEDIHMTDAHQTRREDGEEARLANNVNIILDLVQNHASHDIFELSKAIDYSLVMVNLCKREYLTINLFSRFSQVYSTLRDSGISDSELYHNRQRYFPTLSTYDVEKLLHELIPVLEFLIKYKSGLCESFVIDHIFSKYRVSSISKFTFAVQNYFQRHYKFGDNTEFQVALNILDEYKFKKYIKSLNLLKKSRANDKLDLIKLVNNNIKFQINFKFYDIGLRLKSVNN